MASGFLVSPTSGLVTTETGGSATFGVKLTSAPKANVTVSVTTTDPTEGKTDFSQLTFTPTDWSATKTVTVTGMNDFSDNFNVAYKAVLGPAVSADFSYQGLVPPAVSLTNRYDRAAIEAAARAEISALIMAENMAGHGDSMHGRMDAAALALVDLDSVTAFAIRSGSWSDPATWLGGAVPGANDRAWIMPGRVVTIDRVLNGPVETLRVGGTLAFAPAVDTELRVDTVVVDPSGTLQMGTPAAPIAAHRTATLKITGATAALDRAWDPYGLSRGLVSLGSVTINGADKLDTAYLAAVPAVGATQITLTGTATGWRPGDRIVLPGTSTQSNQDEVFRVLAVFGKVITLDQPVKHARSRPVADLPLVVSNLTRNAAIRSESTSTIERRGHVMSMHSSDFQVSNAAFIDLGRSDKSIEVNDPVVDEHGHLVAGTGTNPRGRYPLHVHMAGPDSAVAVTVRGSVVEGSPNWGFVNHSSNVRFEDNVSYQTFGAGFVSEDGNEVGAFVRNTALRSIGLNRSPHDGIREYKDDLGYNANGFWISSPTVLVEDNVAVGHVGLSGAGFLFFPGPKASTREPNPLGARNNLVYAASAGVEFWFTQPYKNDGKPQDFKFNMVSGNTFYNVTSGVLAIYTNNVKVTGNRIYGDGSLRGDGIKGNNSFRNLEARDNTIKGFRYGIDAPMGGKTVIDGGVMDNVQDIYVRNNGSQFPRGRSSGLPGESWVRTVDINRVVFETKQPGKLHTIALSEDEPLAMMNPYVRIMPDIIRWDGKQLYYNNQKSTARLTNTGDNSVDTPMPFEGMTNAEAWSRYGVAYAGAIAPADAVAKPWVRGLVGSPTTYDLASSYVPENFLASKSTIVPTYMGPNGGIVTGSSVYLPNLGWNVVTQKIGNRTRSFFFFREEAGPQVYVTGAPVIEASLVNDPDASFTLSFVVVELNRYRWRYITYTNLSQYLSDDGTTLQLPWAFAGTSGAVTSGVATLYIY